MVSSARVGKTFPPRRFGLERPASWPVDVLASGPRVRSRVVGYRVDDSYQDRSVRA